MSQGEPFPEVSVKVKSACCLFCLTFFDLPFRQLKMKGVILMKLKLPLKETRRHQRDPAKVSRVFQALLTLRTFFTLIFFANLPACVRGHGWGLWSAP